MVILKPQRKSLDKPLLVGILLLALFGLLAVFDASVAISLRDFNDKFYLLRSQAIWLVLGLSQMTIASFVNYQIFLRASPLLLLTGLIFLVLVLLPGFGIRALGARRWLALGQVVFQPTEFVKISFILYSASFLAKRKDWGYFFVILAITLCLVLAEPDLGTAIVIAITGMGIFFASGGSLWKFGVFCLLAGVGGSLAIFTSPYRKERLIAFLNPLSDPLGASYHVRQALIAIGSGGLWGLGLGQSRQKFEYLPEATTDSIFAIIAEELGFVGSLTLILLYLFLILRIFHLAKTCPEKEGSLLLTGVGVWLGGQTLINLGAMTALLPLTGVPLPLISYGGSSLVASLVGLGIVLSVLRHRATRK